MSACLLCGCDPSAAIAATWEFFIPIAPPSQNTAAKNTRTAGHAYRELRDDFKTYVMAESRRLRIPRAKARRRLILTRYFTGRAQAYDRGNLIGGMKPLLDAIVSQGLLVDDRPAYLEDIYRQERHDVLAGVAVRLQEFA